MKRGVFVLLGIILASVLVVGSIEVKFLGSGNIVESYEIGDNLQGKINLTIVNEDVDIELYPTYEGDEGLRVNLLEWLEAHSDIDYTCVPGDCTSNYVSTAEENSKNIVAGTHLIGSRVSRDNVEITNYKFDVAVSSGSPSCISQVRIDILDDGIIEWENDLVSVENCGGERKSSCYGTGSFETYVELVSIPYCEKINLPKAPGYGVSAFLKKDAGATGPSDLLEIGLYDPEGELLGDKCTLDRDAVTETGGYVECTISARSEAGEHFICVGLKEGVSFDDNDPNDDPRFHLQGRFLGSSSSFCGFQGAPSETSATGADYNIKATAKKYDTIPSFQITQATHTARNSESLIEYVDDYIQEKFGGDCSGTDGCIVPIKISGSRNLIISAHEIKWDSAGVGTGIRNTNLVTLSKSSAQVTVDNQELDLSLAEIPVPDEEGDYELEVFLDNEKLFTENIEVLEASVGSVSQIYPKFVAAGVNTGFTAFLGSTDDNITIEWDFGDSSTKVEGVEVTHLYSSVGTYQVTVTTYDDGENLGSTVFTVIVTSPKEAINDTINELSDRIDGLETSRDALSSDFQDILIATGLDVVGIRKGLTDIEKNYKALLKNSGSKDSDYIDIMEELNDLNIPISIRPSRVSKLPIAFNSGDVNLKDIKVLFGDFYIEDRASDYEKAVVLWYLENVNAIVEQKTQTIYYESHEKDFVTEVSVQLTPRTSLEEIYFIIERDIDEITFTGNPETYDIIGVTGVRVDLSSGSKTIDFFVEGNVESFGIPMYLAPKLDDLNIKKVTKYELPENSPWKTIIGLLILAVFVLMLYILLQEWYKRKYEVYLFKNKNNLYNLLFFIKNAKAKKITEGEIRRKLRKAKWRNEQITYALKKEAGKRVGMWEIPILRGFERKRINEEMAKRQRKARISF